MCAATLRASEATEPCHPIAPRECSRQAKLALISGHLGKSDRFDKAIAAFSIAYADQNEKDHAALKRAIHDEKVKAVIEKEK
jgi:hypothetical protein